MDGENGSTISKGSCLDFFFPPKSDKEKSSSNPLSAVELKPAVDPPTVLGDEDEDFTSLPSLPMPNFSPPPLPAEVLLKTIVDCDADSYGITLYDFESDLDDDLSFKVCYSFKNKYETILTFL